MVDLNTKLEVATRTRISERHLDNCFAAGNGPVRTYIGKRVFVREHHFQEWLARLAEKPEPPEVNLADHGDGISALTNLVQHGSLDLLVVQIDNALPTKDAAGANETDIAAATDISIEKPRCRLPVRHRAG